MAELERDQLALHAVFVMVAAIGLGVEPGPSIGWRLLLLGGLYHAATVAVAWPGRHWPWLRLWWFAVGMGVLLLPAEAVLATGLGVVAHDAGGAPTLLGVPVSLGLLGAVPVVLVVGGADAVGRRRGELASWVTAPLVGVVAVAGLEATLLAVGARESVGAARIGALAPHGSPAAATLGVAALAGVRWTREAGPWRTLAVALVAALITAGAATYGWALVEGAG